MSRRSRHDADPEGAEYGVRLGRPRPGGRARRRSWGTLLTLVAALLLGLSQPSAADTWYVHYQRAKQKLGREEWEGAVEELNEAVARKGDSSANARTYGMQFTSYFPYLKLGIAYLELDDPAAALRAFETEERLGAIASSPPDLAQLERFRGRARERIREIESAQRKVGEEITAEVLARVRSLRDQGRVEEALTELADVLALEPADAGAVALETELRDLLAAEQLERQRIDTAAELARDGRRLLDEGKPREAAAAFEQARALDPRADVEGPLATALEAISAERRDDRPEATAADPAPMIEDRLDAARSAARDGRPAAALDLLRGILAVEPDHEEAVALRRSLVEAESERRQTAMRRVELDRLVDSAAVALAAGDHDAALAAVNLALAIDPDDTRAIAQLATAYRGIARRLVRHGGGDGNLPPAIRFTDLRAAMEDGSVRQVVDHPAERIVGVVIDEGPVRLSALDPRGEPVPVASRGDQHGDVFVAQFHLDVELAAGASTYRIVAADDGDLEAVSEYSFLYRAPPWRRPWILGGVLVLSLATGGLGLAVRRRREARALARRPNPYVAGAPVFGREQFFGREDLIREVVAAVPNNSLLLHGERRIGKTSIQHHLRERLREIDDPEYLFHPVYVDLQGTPGERLFATLAAEVFHQLGPTLEGLAPCHPPSDPGYGHTDLVTDLRAVLRRLDERSDREPRLVLLIDEIDELNGYDPRINQKLRALFMRSFAQRLRAIVSGVEIRRDWELEGSPWFNFFEGIAVRPLPASEAERLVRQPMRGLFRVDDRVVQRIVEATSGRPYEIQRLCRALVDRGHRLGRRVLTIEDLEAVRREPGGGEA